MGTHASVSLYKGSHIPELDEVCISTEVAMTAPTWNLGGGGAVLCERFGEPKKGQETPFIKRS